MNTGPKVGPAEIWSVLSKSNRPVEIDHRLRILMTARSIAFVGKVHRMRLRRYFAICRTAGPSRASLLSALPRTHDPRPETRERLFFTREEMPYYTCEVKSQERSRVESEEGSHDVVKIRCEIPKEDLRAWGRQLYGFLGILYLPLFVDALWFGNGSHVKLADVEPETEKNRQIVEPVGKALGKVFKRQTPAVVDALAALRDQDALALLAKIETQGKAELNIEGGSVEILAGMVRRYETSSDAERSSNWEERMTIEETCCFLICLPILTPMVAWGYASFNGCFLANIAIGSVFLLVRNLVFALIPLAVLGDRHFENIHLRVRRVASVANDGKEVWELITEVELGLHRFLTPCAYLPSWGILSLRPGDKIKVGFGPFEYLCLFRNARCTPRARRAPPQIANPMINNIGPMLA